MAGLSSTNAHIAVDVLVRTSLRGVDTHGVSRIPQYIDGLLDGSVEANPDVSERLVNGVLHYDGGGGIGQVAGATAMARAIELARTQAFVPCLLSRAGHLGALGIYALMAAEADMVALSCQATPPLMSLPGFKGRAMGNNPLAFGAPVPGAPPMVFDIAASEVAKGKLRQAIREGTPIPDNWAIDEAGNPTTDPKVAWDGAMLPMSGHKGIGIAMLVQLLAASLVGSSAQMLDHGSALRHMSGFFLVINPVMAGAQGFAADVETWLGEYRRVAGNGGRYPGQRAAQLEAQREKSGIPVPEGLGAQIHEVSRKLGITAPSD